jgi:hypothetical protein
MMFRFLGMVAALDEALRRRTVNLIPLNYGLFFLLLGLTVASIQDIRTRPSSPDPQPVSIASLARGAVAAGAYVTVEGTIDPGYWIEVSKKQVSAGRRVHVARWTEQMLPLVDDAAKVGIMIAPSSEQRFSGRVRVTGVVRGLSGGARDVLRRESATLPASLNPELMLASGQKPSSGVLAVVLLTVCPPLAVALLYVRVKRDLIFRTRREEPRRVDLESHGEPIDLRVTGRLRLDGGRPRRFVEVPVQGTVNAQAELELGASLDASLYVFGLCVRERIGFWSLVIPPDSVGTIERGELAFGLGIRPAAKMRINGSRPQVVTLSFATLAQRERFLRGLAYQRFARDAAAVA